MGKEITGNNLVSGSDAAANRLFMDFYPKFTINKALMVKGSYRIGSWDNPYPETSRGLLTNSKYFNSQGYGIQRSFSPGYWNYLLVTANTPWRIFQFGKGPYPFGLGLVLDAADEFSGEFLFVAVPFGPFVFAAYYSPWRRGQFVNYPVLTDRSNQMEPEVGGTITYSSGPFQIGLLLDYWKMHQGPESQLSVARRRLFRPLDITALIGSAYLKYFNGRYFFNAEMGLFNMATRRSGNELGDPGLGNQYWENWTGAIETGVVAGPAKLSVLLAHYPGFDRRGGRLIDRQPTAPAAFVDNGVSLYRPYSLLLSYNYGSGNNSFTYASQHGFMTDASSLGLRVDYALAANLNLFATAFYARRVSQGLWLGWIRPNPTDVENPSLQYGLTITHDGQINLDFFTQAPNITERDLGYEFGCGFGWALLEGLTIHTTCAYWQPGSWFKYACIDRSVMGWNVPVAGNNWGVNADRAIDPIFGMNIKMEVEF